MKLVSYTFSREELWKSVKEHMKLAAKDLIDDLLEFGPNAANLNTMGKYKDNLNLQIQYWCDCLSEEFFKNHPDVCDVLVLENHRNKDIPMKIWMASK